MNEYTIYQKFDLDRLFQFGYIKFFGQKNFWVPISLKAQVFILAEARFNLEALIQAEKDHRYTFW